MQISRNQAEQILSVGNCELSKEKTIKSDGINVINVLHVHKTSFGQINVFQIEMNRSNIQYIRVLVILLFQAQKLEILSDLVLRKVYGKQLWVQFVIIFYLVAGKCEFSKKSNG